MNEYFIFSIQQTLKKALFLLEKLNPSIYNDASIPPFYSSIGCHIRHILDFYTSIFKAELTGCIDLTDRLRETKLEMDIVYAKEKIEEILKKLESYKVKNLKSNYELIDDLGSGKVTITTNLYATFIQANSHTIHHFAIISQLLFAFGIALEDTTFGYNPTSPINNKS